MNILIVDGKFTISKIVIDFSTLNIDHIIRGIHYSGMGCCYWN
jgi:hypothetical protein